MRPRILVIDIIMSRNLHRDQQPQTIRILQEWYKKTTTKKSLLYACITIQIQNTRIDQTLPILKQSGGGGLLLTWINFNSNMDR